MRFGKLPKKEDARNFQLRKYLKRVPPPVPTARDWSRPVGYRWGMMLNDRLGCCTASSAGHMIQAWTANASQIVTLPDSAIERFYRKFSPAPGDDGAYMLDVLKTWRKEGVTAENPRRVEAFVEISQGDVWEMKTAIALFGGAYIGMALPNFSVRDDPFDVEWDVPRFWRLYPSCWRNPSNGHCVNLVAYDANWLYCVTWGRVKRLSWDFWRRYGDESYAVLNPDWIAASGFAPSGLDMLALRNDLNALEGD